MWFMMMFRNSWWRNQYEEEKNTKTENKETSMKKGQLYHYRIFISFINSSSSFMSGMEMMMRLDTKYTKKAVATNDK